MAPTERRGPWKVLLRADVSGFSRLSFMVDAAPGAKIQAQCLESEGEFLRSRRGLIVRV